MLQKSVSGAHRGGTYIRQPAGYLAFNPADLPPLPPISISDGLQQKLSAADYALGQLDGSVLALPDVDLFVSMFVRREAVLSSQIEGTQASLTDLLTYEARLATTGPDDVIEVVNYVTALNFGISRLDTLPMSVRLICEIHEKLLASVRGSQKTPGELRRSQNWIGAAGCTIDEALFVPPPWQQLPDLLGKLEAFIHQQDSLPQLVKIALIHAQFETIHPFLDGNGRLGRLLITFYLFEKKLLHKPALYLSLYFKKHRQTYYDKLQTTREAGDWEGWIDFFLTGVIETARQASNTARQIIAMRELHRNQLIKSRQGSALNALTILESLYRQPFTSVQNAQVLLDVSYPTANDAIHQLRSLGVIDEITGQKRNRLFVYQHYLNLFRDLQT
jgi:Fic family protein